MNFITVFPESLKRLFFLLRDYKGNLDMVEGLQKEISHEFKIFFGIDLLTGTEKESMNPLTFSQRVCLALHFLRRSRKEIASLLHVTENSVKYQQRVINEKLGSQYYRESLFIALSRGYIIARNFSFSDLQKADGLGIYFE